MNHKANAVTLFQKGVEAVMPRNLHFDLDRYKGSRITLLGSGKAAVAMAKTLLKEGVAIKKSFLVSSYAAEVPGLEIFVSSHPIPSKKSVEAADRLMEIAASLREEDRFVYLLSGGSSALIEKPIPPVTLDAFIETTERLLSSGASVGEINIVRKHLSLIKGGRLAQMTRAKGIVYVMSDVIGDDLEAIGSAPLFCDSSSCADAREVLVQYGLWEKVSPAIRYLLASFCDETPKRPKLEIVHKIVASNRGALEAVAESAKEMGYGVEIVSDRVAGDVRTVAAEIVETALKREAQKPFCLLFGGETTVEVKGDGRGGRNQELALWVLKEMPSNASWTFLSAGTDGIDGMSDAAGAVVEDSDLHEDIDTYLQRNDTYHYHQKYGTLIRTGASGTNVMDIMILIKE